MLSLAKWFCLLQFSMLGKQAPCGVSSGIWFLQHRLAGFLALTVVVLLWLRWLDLPSVLSLALTMANHLLLCWCRRDLPQILLALRFHTSLCYNHSRSLNWLLLHSLCLGSFFKSIFFKSLKASGDFSGKSIESRSVEGDWNLHL